jgi:hypothetical protein
MSSLRHGLRVVTAEFRLEECSAEHLVVPMGKDLILEMVVVGSGDPDHVVGRTETQDTESG